MVIQKSNIRRATQVFPHFWLIQSHKPHPLHLQYDMLRDYSVVKFLPYDVWSPAHLIGYTMAANHDLLDEDGVF